MPVAEVIAIGTELLLGDIQDTNTRYLAKQLRSLGINLYRCTIVGDNLQRISQAVKEALGRAQIVITAGGLGPTIDDPTRQAIARALDVELEFKPELWEKIKARFLRSGRTATENNRRQAFIPAHAMPLENPVGTAPAFVAEKDETIVISLPGVPGELENIMENQVIPLIRNRFKMNEVIKSRVIHTAGIGESRVDELIGDLETSSNPTVGLLAHPGQVDIRIVAKAASGEQADEMNAIFSEKIYGLLGEAIYGEDSTSLEQTIIKLICEQGCHLKIIESGFSGLLQARLKDPMISYEDAPEFPSQSQDDAIERYIEGLILPSPYYIVVFARFFTRNDHFELQIAICYREKNRTTHYYSGPPSARFTWVTNIFFDQIRKHLINRGE